MITFALDLAIFAIIGFCGWRGYKSGLIRGVFGVVTLILSLFIASVVASAYSTEFKEVLNPFVGGIIDSTLIDIIEEEENPYPETEEMEDKSEGFILSYSSLRRIGLPESASLHIAELTAQENEEDVTAPNVLSGMITENLSTVFAFAVVFGIAFIVLAIVFTVIGNLVSVALSLPGLKLIDSIAGAALGVVKGLIIVFTLAAIIRYVGLLAPETLEGTAILKYFVNHNLIADLLGI